jgi:xanthine dehydrogenase small subunit
MAPIAAALGTLAANAPLAITDAHGARAFVPHTVDQLAALHQAYPQARLLGGATDIGLWVNKQHKSLPLLIAIGGVAEMRRIEQRDDGVLSIGAAASLEDAWSALARRHPELTEMWLRFASPPVRHAGTLGGNIANGSPIGDGAPVLMALDATLLLRQGRTTRRVRLDAFYLDYMKNVLQPGEFVQAIEVPAPTFSELRAYKLSKRFDSDISGLSAGLALTLDGATVHDARLVFGGMAAVVKRAAQAEAALRGQPWNEATAEAAAAALARDFAPISDLRASASYRQRAAANLLRRLWLETRRDAPLAPQQVSVFARETTS